MIGFCPTCCEVDLGGPCIECGLYTCNVCDGSREHEAMWHIWEAWQE